MSMKNKLDRTPRAKKTGSIEKLEQKLDRLENEEQEQIRNRGGIGDIYGWGEREARFGRNRIREVIGDCNRLKSHGI